MAKRAYSELMFHVVSLEKKFWFLKIQPEDLPLWENKQNVIHEIKISWPKSIKRLLSKSVRLKCKRRNLDPHTEGFSMK